jgi:regulator of replication initiation timing
MSKSLETFGQLQIENKNLRESLSRLHLQHEQTTKHNTALMHLVESQKKEIQNLRDQLDQRMVEE